MSIKAITFRLAGVCLTVACSNWDGKIYDESFLERLGKGEDGKWGCPVCVFTGFKPLPWVIGPTTLMVYRIVGALKSSRLGKILEVDALQKALEELHEKVSQGIK